MYGIFITIVIDLLGADIDLIDQTFGNQVGNIFRNFDRSIFNTGDPHAISQYILSFLAPIPVITEMEIEHPNIE